MEPRLAPVARETRRTEGPAPPSSRGVTPRALLLGTVMAGLIVGMTQVLSIRYSAAEVAGTAPPPAPTALLFLYVLLGGPLLRRLGHRFALSRGELLLIYMMMLIAGPISHPYAIGFFVPHAVAPYHFAAQEPGWRAFLPALPPWLGPQDRSSVIGFFSGTGGAVPWSAWLVPMLAWGALLFAMFTVMFCLNVIMEKQWIEHERLAFPLAALPLALTADPARPQDGYPPLLRTGVFWLGIGLALLLQAPSAIYRYIPSVPNLPLSNVLIVDAGRSMAPPWNALGDISFTLIFWLVGAVYLIPTEISFSVWFFYVIASLENVSAVWLGKSGECPNPFIDVYPVLYAQGGGAGFALALLALYTARRHLRDVMRKALWNDRSVDDSRAFLSYRTAVAGIVLGSVAILAWGWLAGMRLWVAALFFGLLLGLYFLFARIRAETGLTTGSLVYPRFMDELMLTFMGARYMTLPEATMVYATRWIHNGGQIGSVVGCQLEGFKLADAGGLRMRSVGAVIAWTAILTVPLAMVWTLKTYYATGFDVLPSAQRGTAMVGTQIHNSYSILSHALANPEGPQWAGIAAISLGALVTITLGWLRTHCLWFPLHPIGYLVANAWGMHITWASFFLGWLIKVLVTRYGGLRVYRHLLPLFLGIIVGDVLHQCLWGLVAWATGTMAADTPY